VNLPPWLKAVLVNAVVVFALASCTIALFGCTTTGRPEPDPLVIAACPALTDVTVLTRDDSWRLHIEDARQYNKCRCAALKDTSEACKAPKPVE
jgi:hypothetical protein